VVFLQLGYQFMKDGSVISVLNMFKTSYISKLSVYWQSFLHYIDRSTIRP
jgi:hypothetical protein